MNTLIPVNNNMHHTAVYRTQHMRTKAFQCSCISAAQELKLHNRGHNRTLPDKWGNYCSCCVVWRKVEIFWNTIIIVSYKLSVAEDVQRSPRLQMQKSDGLRPIFSPNSQLGAAFSQQIARPSQGHVYFLLYHPLGKNKPQTSLCEKIS